MQVRAVHGGPSVPANLSMDISWCGAHKRVNIKDAVTGFGGSFTEGTGDVRWSARQEGFRIVSDPLDPAAIQFFFFEVGHERNGVFFPPGEDGTLKECSSKSNVDIRTPEERRTSMRRWGKKK